MRDSNDYRLEKVREKVETVLVAHKIEVDTI